MRTSIQSASVVVLLATLAAPACIVAGADLKYVEREEKRFTTSTTPHVNLATFDGAIEVRPWDKPEVLVVVEKRGMAKEDVATISIRADQNGDAVTVDVTDSRRHDGGVHFFGINMRSAKLIVSLPAASEVTAKSSDGSIDVESLTGKLDLRSGDGSIRGRSLTGTVNARTGDGSIRLDDVAGALDVDTGDGSIHVTGKLTAIRARSGDGSMTIRAEPGSTAGADWDITTGDGSVTLEIPDGFNADLDAHTGDGGVHVGGVGLSDSDSDGERRESRRRNTVRGKIGSGGKQVRIRTGDGSITLRRS